MHDPAAKIWWTPSKLDDFLQRPLQMQTFIAPSKAWESAYKADEFPTNGPEFAKNCATGPASGTWWWGVWNFYQDTLMKQVKAGTEFLPRGHLKGFDDHIVPLVESLEDTDNPAMNDDFLLGFIAASAQRNNVLTRDDIANLENHYRNLEYLLRQLVDPQFENEDWMNAVMEFEAIANRKRTKTRIECRNHHKVNRCQRWTREGLGGKRFWGRRRAREDGNTRPRKSARLAEKPRVSQNTFEGAGMSTRSRSGLQVRVPRLMMYVNYFDDRDAYVNIDREVLPLLSKQLTTQHLQCGKKRP